MSPRFLVDDVDTWPLVLVVSELALIYGLEESVIVQAVQAGTFQPAPLDGQDYRWSKVHVLEDLQSRPDRLAAIPFPVRSRSGRKSLKTLRK
jgi:hypothetical protein